MLIVDKVKLLITKNSKCTQNILITKYMYINPFLQSFLPACLPIAMIFTAYLLAMWCLNIVCPVMMECNLTISSSRGDSRITFS